MIHAHLQFAFDNKFTSVTICYHFNKHMLQNQKNVGANIKMIFISIQTASKC